MTTPSKAAKWLYILALTPMYIGGAIYFFTRQFMPYHAVAVGKQWNEIDQPMQVLILATLNADGGLIICNAIAMTILLAIPFGKGELWASWAITAIGTTSMLTGIKVAIEIDTQTAANPPWIIFVLVIILLILALFFSVKNNRSLDKH